MVELVVAVVDVLTALVFAVDVVAARVVVDVVAGVVVTDSVVAVVAKVIVTCFVSVVTGVVVVGTMTGDVNAPDVESVSGIGLVETGEVGCGAVGTKVVDI